MTKSGTVSWWNGLLRRRALPAVVMILFAGCDQFGQAMTVHTNVVAQAEGRELAIQEAAQMLAANLEVPPDPQVVRALADLWVDYTLLSVAVLDDSALTALDMDAFVQEVRDQALIGRLRDQVAQADTIFDDAEVAARWVTEGPSAEISARHILLRAPTDGTDVQRDSVRQLAESLRSRAAAGESFAELAIQFSQDGSAPRGGDLGFFGRGQMVAPFEDAAFALQPGEISPVVETPFGYHVILVEDRRQQELGEERESFRQYLVQRSVEDAELAYLDSISAAANVEVTDGAMEVVREIANRPTRTLTGRQGGRAIATYDGGDFTAEEFAGFIRNQPPEVQSAFGTATDEQLDSGIQQLVQMELLLAEAESQGMTLTAEEEEQIRSDARTMIQELVQATGFSEAARQSATPAMLDELVKTLVQGVITGEAPYIPLGRLGIALREIYSYEVYDAAFSEVVAQLEVIRAQQPQQQVPAGVIPGMPESPMPEMQMPAMAPGVPSEVPAAGAVQPAAPTGQD